MSKTVGHNGAQAIGFVCHAPKAKGVFLAGTFNDWSPASMPMAKDPQGSWNAALDLQPGRYEYKFVIDGAWCCESGCDGAHQSCPKCVPNSFGTMNRVIEVA